MSKIILIGKTGQVASELKKLINKNDDYILYNYGSKELDFTNLEQLEQSLHELPEADFLINAAAYNLVDQAEDEPEIADLINHQAVALIAKYCARQHIKFIHYSTNYVFAGNSQEALKEQDIAKPISIYAKTKLAGEQAVIASDCEYLILRVATVFNKTANNFFTKISKLAASHAQLKIVADQITNPTSSKAIAEATLQIIAQLLAGKKITNEIYHLASKQQISYYEFAQLIVAYLKEVGEDCIAKEIIAVTSAEFSTKAQRPLNAALDVGKIKQDFGIVINLEL